MGDVTIAVVGPESSGGRFVAEWLSGAGLVVSHWSWPHGPDHAPRRWPIRELRSFINAAVSPEVILTVREPTFCAASQVSKHGVSEAQAQLSITDALRQILSCAVDAPTRVLVYEALIAQPHAVAHSLGEWLDAELSVPDVRDEDAKWAFVETERVHA